MSDCRQTRDRLTPYADREIPADERADIDRHLGQCPPCRTAADEEQGGRSLVRGPAGHLRSAPPPGLRTRCEALARAHCASRRSIWRAGGVPAMVTAVLVLLVGAALFSLATRRSNALLAAQLTADHVKCFRLFAPSAASTADAAAVERDLSARYGRDVHIPRPSAAAGVSLVGARRCFYADGLMPHMMYRVHGHDVSLFVLHGASRQAADVTTLQYHSRIWSRGDTTYVLVAPASAGDLTPVVRDVMRDAP